MPLRPSLLRCPRAHGDVHVFNETTSRWDFVAVSGDRPDGRYGHMGVYDKARDRLIIFGGEANPASDGCTACRDDVWALNMSVEPWSWQQLAPHEDKIDRRNAAMIYDPVRERLLVWGGTQNGQTTLTNAKSSLWAFDLRAGHEGWHEVPVNNEAEPRTSARAIYDATQDRMIVGFENSDKGVYQDLWEVSLGSQ